jgi:chromosome segregation ATPase
MDGLEQQVHYYIRQIEITKRETAEAETKLAYSKKRLAVLKNEYLSIKIDNKKQRAIQRLKKRIHDERNNLGKVESDNTTIRNEINVLRHSNNALNGSCAELEKEAAALQEQLGVMAKQRHEAIEDCNALKEEIQEIKNEEEEHEEQYIAHMKEQSLAHEVVKRKLGENRMEKTRRQITEQVDTFRSAGVKKKQAIAQDVQKARWHVAVNSIYIKKTKSKAEMLKTAFQKIQERTGIASINQLVQDFEKFENESHKLRQQVTEVENAREVLRAANESLQLKVNRIKEEGKQVWKQKRVTHSLQESLERLKRTKVELQNKILEQEKIMRHVHQQVQGMFWKLNCQDPKLLQMLSSHGINDITVLHFLGGIEKSIVDIRRTYQRYRHQCSDGRPATDRERQNRTVGAVGTERSGGRRVDAPQMGSKAVNDLFGESGELDDFSVPKSKAILLECLKSRGYECQSTEVNAGALDMGDTLTAKTDHDIGG